MKVSMVKGMLVNRISQYVTDLSLFTTIPLKETIEICANELFIESETNKGLRKFEFKELSFFATKDVMLYKQIDGLAMACPLGIALANAFLV